MSSKFSFIFTFLICLLWSGASFAQSDVTVGNCTKYLKPPFISDGQQYRALLTGDEIAEFHTTFFADNLYRIVGASGNEEGNVIISIYDQENHLLFTNKNHRNSPYWDFKFEYTINCTIEARLNTKKVKSGLVLLLIGFQQ